MEPDYDIFSGEKDKGYVWVEAVANFMRANERMKQIAARKPGPYFVFCHHSHSIVAEVDTTKKIA